MSYVYILHADTPLAGHAWHYCGATHDLLRRLREHATGDGACITAAFLEAAIEWQVAAVYVSEKSPFECERWLKRQHETHRFCPICSGEGLTRTMPYCTMIEPDALGIPVDSVSLRKTR